MMRLIFITFALAVFAVGAFGQIPKSCSEIKGIKQLPHVPREAGTDKAYDEVISQGDAVVPCLIGEITNTKITRDPRCPTINQETKIGDVAFWVVTDILSVMWTDFLPDKVRTEFKTRGDYAYEDYIVKPHARSELQARVRKWYSEHRKKQ